MRRYAHVAFAFSLIAAIVGPLLLGFNLALLLPTHLQPTWHGVALWAALTVLGLSGLTARNSGIPSETSQAWSVDETRGWRRP